MRFDAFVREETAAVITDWVVLTAGVFAGGIAVLAVASGGVENIAFEIGDELASTDVSDTYRYFGVSYEGYVRGVAWSSRTTEEQVALFQALVDPAITSDENLQAEHALWAGLAADPDYPDHDLASERVALIEVAMDARGLEPQPVG